MEEEQWRTEGAMQTAAEEDPSNKLPSSPLQRLSSWMPLSGLIHTRACLYCTHTQTVCRHTPSQCMQMAHARFAAFSKRAHARTQPSVNR